MLSIKLTDVMLTALAAFLSSTGRMDRNRSASPVTFFFSIPSFLLAEIKLLLWCVSLLNFLAAPSGTALETRTRSAAQSRAAQQAPAMQK
jgi:hypothetical protein